MRMHDWVCVKQLPVSWLLLNTSHVRFVRCPILSGIIPVVGNEKTWPRDESRSYHWADYYATAAMWDWWDFRYFLGYFLWWEIRTHDWVCVCQLPVNLFPHKDRLVRFVSPPIVSGMFPVVAMRTHDWVCVWRLPVNWLLNKYRTVKFVRLPMVSGMFPMVLMRTHDWVCVCQLPLSWLLFNHRTRIFWRFPILSGIVPVVGN